MYRGDTTSVVAYGMQGMTEGGKERKKRETKMLVFQYLCKQQDFLIFTLLNAQFTSVND